MKFFSFLSTCLFAAVLVSCSGSGSSSGCFGTIPSTLAEYENESAELHNEITSNNYEKQLKKIQELKTDVATKIEEEAKKLNGTEIAVSVDETILKIEQPVTLVFVGMNKHRPIFSLNGKIVASQDLTLNADPSDLKGDILLSTAELVFKVNMPVKLEFLDKDGKAIESSQSGHDIGLLPAEIVESSAIVKAGTALNFDNHQFVVDEKFSGVESLRIVADLSKSPYISRSLK